MNTLLVGDKLRRFMIAGGDSLVSSVTTEEPLRSSTADCAGYRIGMIAL